MNAKVLETICGEQDKPLRIGNIEIPCYVLEDETRVLTRTGFIKAIGRTGKAKGGRQHDDELQTPVFLTADKLKPYLPKDLDSNSKPIPFSHKGINIIGYRAELLGDVCDTFIDAKDAGALRPNQLHIAAACRTLQRGFARVGIIAMVDEVTGYQYLRARRSLEQILDKFLRKELGKWAKRFPDEFYEQMFRLRGWDYRKFSTGRPSVVGKYTNDLVYARITPQLLEKLLKREPKDEKGRRKHHLHRWLTDDIGHPELEKHLHALIALERANTSWDRFYRCVQRAFPKLNSTIELNLTDKEGEPV